MNKKVTKSTAKSSSKLKLALDDTLLWVLDQVDNPAICLTSDQKIIAINIAALGLMQQERKAVLHKSFLKILEKKGLTTNLPEELSISDEEIEIISPIYNTAWADLRWTLYPAVEKGKKKPSYFILIAHHFPSQTVIEPSLTMDSHFNLRELIRDVTNLIRPFAEKKGLTVASDYPVSIPEIVTGNQQRIYRVLLGVIGNAVKYTSEGDVFVTVEEVARTPDTITLRLIVQDTGEGISQEKYTTIFEKRNKHYSREIDLDLYTIKQLVESMRGEVQVESTLGHGSTFSLILPFSLFEEQSVSKGEPKLGQTVGERQPIRVLVVEDDVVCQSAIKIFLSDLHCEVDMASSAQEALKLLSNPYDVILMDIGLPDKDGMSFTFELRTKLNVETPTIAITGYKWDRDQYSEKGFNGLIRKPVSREKLEHALFRALYFCPKSEEDQ